MPSSRKPTIGSLDWITQSSHPSQTNQDRKPQKDSDVILNRLLIKEKQPNLDILPEPVSPLNVDIPESLLNRLHSVVGWDEERRSIKEIVTLILKEGLAKFPDKGAAPPSYLARLKSFGKRKGKT